MAVEVDLREYIFREKTTHVERKEPATKPPVKSTLDVLMEPISEGEDDVDENMFEPVKLFDIPQLVFVHNPLHDLESLKWAGVNMIADRQIIGVDSGKKRAHEDNHPSLYEQYEWARKLFFNSTERLKFLAFPHHFAEFIKTLDPRVQPLGLFLQNISTELVARYRLVEQDVELIDFNAAGNLYTLFRPTKANNLNLKQFEGIRLGRIDYEALEETERNKLRRLL